MRQDPYSYAALPTVDPVENARTSSLAKVVSAEFIRSASLERASRPSLLARWRQGDFTIIPDGNPVLDVWDSIVISALFATAFCLPFEVALVMDLPASLKMFDHFIDLIFSIDIILTFNVAYVPRDDMGADHYERSPINIAKQYMAVPFSDNFTAGWFWPDVLTVIPWDAMPALDSGAGNGLKFVRVLRLVRMLRLVRVVKLFKRMHTKVGFSFALVKLLRCMGVTLLLVHWLACGWAHLGMHGHEYTKSDVNWMSNTQLTHEKELADFTIFDAYMLALYFCFVVLTTVGFGDIVPLTNFEVIMMIVTILLTGLTWAWVVANVVDVISHMDVYGTHFNQVMDDLNQLMDDKAVGTSLQVRVRRHMHEAYHVHRHRHHQETVRWLSNGLQGELAVASGVDEVCSHIWYFRDLANSGWVVDLAQHFTAEMYSPDEYISTTSSVSVVRKGSCVRKGLVLTRNAVIGEDMILVTEVLRDSSPARTLSLCELMTLQRNKLLQVCERHEEVNVRLRRAQVKLALWRAFVYVARKLRHRTDVDRKSKSNWDTLLGDNDERPDGGGGAASADSNVPLACHSSRARIEASDKILASLRIRRRDGWVENGGGLGALMQNVTRKAESLDNERSEDILVCLRKLCSQAEQQQAETDRQLDALGQRLDELDRRTEALDRRRQEELHRAPRTDSPQARSGRASHFSPRTGSRLKFGFR